MSHTNNAKQGTQWGRPDRLKAWAAELAATVTVAVLYLVVLPLIAAGN